MEGKLARLSVLPSAPRQGCSRVARSCQGPAVSALQSYVSIVSRRVALSPSTLAVAAARAQLPAIPSTARAIFLNESVSSTTAACVASKVTGAWCFLKRRRLSPSIGSPLAIKLMLAHSAKRLHGGATRAPQEVLTTRTNFVIRARSAQRRALEYAYSGCTMTRHGTVQLDTRGVEVGVRGIDRGAEDRIRWVAPE